MKWYFQFLLEPFSILLLVYLVSISQPIWRSFFSNACGSCCIPFLKEMICFLLSLLGSFGDFLDLIIPRMSERWSSTTLYIRGKARRKWSSSGSPA